MANSQSTADYRKYPKGPNFLAIVLGFCAAILIVLAIAYLFLSDYGKHLFRHANPDPQTLRLSAPAPSAVASEVLAWSHFTAASRFQASSA